MDGEFRTYRYGPLAATKPRQLVVLLHGLGSDGQDLISLAPIFAQGLPNALFVSPDAPFPCDIAPMGYQWFSLQEWTEDAMLKGIEKVRPLVDNFLDKLLKSTGLSEADMALVGFSQGTMTSLYVAPRRQNACAGVLGYSGALLGGKGQMGTDTHKLPTCLIHGVSDTVVPVSAWHQAMEILRKADVPVEGDHFPNLAHGIDERGLAAGLAFLRKILPA
ncbi:MAG: dienelactone hydrolase family protein [Alphaproteobacteria bacterium]|nr:dienelactone hydrolase family protein [Alphaproteobacteria bacterium]